MSDFTKIKSNNLSPLKKRLANDKRTTHCGSPGVCRLLNCFERQLIHLTHKPSISMRGKGDLIH